MKSLSKIKFFFLFLFLFVNFYAHSQNSPLANSCCSKGGRCVGSVNCSACTNCKYCKYCNSGGSCGVCSTSESIERIAPPSILLENNVFDSPTNNNNSSAIAKTYRPSKNTPDTYYFEKNIDKLIEADRANYSAYKKRFTKIKNGEKVYGTYHGPLLDGKPHGYGTFIYDNGDWFKGQYNYGIRCGQGISYYHSSDTKEIRNYEHCN